MCYADSGIIYLIEYSFKIILPYEPYIPLEFIITICNGITIITSKLYV